MKLTEAQNSKWIQVDAERTLLVDRGCTTLLVDAGVPDHATLLIRLSTATPALLNQEGRGE